MMHQNSSSKKMEEDRISQLHVSFSPELMPRGMVFASKTLRELELNQFGYVTYFPEQFFFPHLKTLHLKSYIFVYGSYTISREPFSGFPELEKLTLCRCIVWGIVLKAPRLRFLEIIGDRGSSYFPRGMLADEISAPLLTWFRYEGFSDFECSKLNLPMLEEVYLDIYKRVIMKGMHLKCVRMLQQLGNATTIALTLDTLTVLATDRCFIEQSPSPFPYMKRLKLMKGRWEISTELQSVMNYLTVGTLHYESLMVEVVEENLEDLSDDDDDNELLGVFELFELYE